MLAFIKKHPNIIWIVLAVVVAVTILSVYQRQQYMKNPYANQIGNPKRNGESYEDTFYYDQLTDKEKMAYDSLSEAVREFKGGVVILPEGLNGQEFSRVSQALECGNQDLFYAMIEVPMTEKGQSVNYIQRNILNISDGIITQCMLFLYPAEGLNINGDIDKEGYVKNLDDLKQPLATMDEKKLERVNELQENTTKILDDVISKLPKEYGTKEAIDYFLNWMDDNLVMDEALMESTNGLSDMTDVFEQVYFENHLTCVVDGKAMASGYSKVLTYLCNKSGIDAHIVAGNWKGSNAYTLVCVDFDGTPVFIDASGYKAKDLWNQRYISETLAGRYLTFADYFDIIK